MNSPGVKHLSSPNSNIHHWDVTQMFHQCDPATVRKDRLHIACTPSSTLPHLSCFLHDDEILESDGGLSTAELVTIMICALRQATNPVYIHTSVIPVCPLSLSVPTNPLIRPCKDYRLLLLRPPGPYCSGLYRLSPLSIRHPLLRHSRLQRGRHAPYQRERAAFLYLPRLDPRQPRWKHQGAAVPRQQTLEYLGSSCSGTVMSTTKRPAHPFAPLASVGQISQISRKPARTTSGSVDQLEPHLVDEG